MLHHYMEIWLPEIISLIEIAGILIIGVGLFKSFYHYIISSFTSRRYPIKLELANALALGLEFKMGAEILKTVIIRTMDVIIVLGAIILLRAILSLLIHYEMKVDHEYQEEKLEIKDQY